MLEFEHGDTIGPKAFLELLGSLDHSFEHHVGLGLLIDEGIAFLDITHLLLLPQKEQ